MPKFARFKPRRVSAKYLQGAPAYVAAIYDNGGKTADRYIVVYTSPIWTDDYARHSTDPRLQPARAMSVNPFSPQGVGLFVDCMRGKHLGRLIAWKDLPDKCQQCVINDGVLDGE